MVVQDPVTELMPAHFAAVSSVYRDVRTTDEAPVRAIAERLRGQGPIRAADIGCGTGRYDELLFRELPGLHLTLVDASAEMLGQARTFLRARGITEFETHHAAVEDLSLPPDSLDCVFTFNAIHHFDVPALLSKTVQAVREGGRLFVYTRLPDQNARSIWGQYFPDFMDRETRLYEMGDLYRWISQSPGLVFQAATCFRFPRVSTLARLTEQARARHYSTFTLYEDGEFEAAMTAFERSLRREFEDPDRIEWCDENVLIEARRIDS
ncbi:MAG: methyltransferase domain-containing protein [Dehalococcoidia bacterium]